MKNIIGQIILGIGLVVGWISWGIYAIADRFLTYD